MIFGVLLGLAGKILPQLFGTIDKFVEDKDKANELKAMLENQFMKHMGAELEAKRDIIVAEARGDSWLQRSWRPITMLTFLVLVCADSFGWLANPLADQAWTLLQIGLGGYVVGRSAEKVTGGITSALKKKDET